MLDREIGVENTEKLSGVKPVRTSRGGVVNTTGKEVRGAHVDHTISSGSGKRKRKGDRVRSSCRVPHCDEGATMIRNTAAGLRSV